jgi:hypothetical protein
MAQGKGIDTMTISATSCGGIKPKANKSRFFLFYEDVNGIVQEMPEKTTLLL